MDRPGSPIAGTDGPQGLNALFAPRSIAIIGASADRDRIGGRMVAYLKQHFSGAIYPINPNRNRLQELPAYSDIGAAPTPVDLALVSVPTAAAMEALEACAAKGVAAAIVFSSGFAEAGREGEALQDRIRALAETSGMAVLGPNCLGAMDAHNGVTATFTLALDIIPLRPGPIAVVSQSGAFAAHVMAMSAERGLGLRNGCRPAMSASSTRPISSPSWPMIPRGAGYHAVSGGLPRRRETAPGPREGTQRRKAGDRDQSRALGGGGAGGAVAYRRDRRIGGGL